MSSSEVKSKLRLTVVINADHEGEVCDLDQGTVAQAIGASIRLLFEEEDDGLDVQVSTYVQSYSYRDNLESLRERVRARIEQLDQESLVELERKLKEST